MPERSPTFIHHLDAIRCLVSNLLYTVRAFDIIHGTTTEHNVYGPVEPILRRGKS